MKIVVFLLLFTWPELQASSPFHHLVNGCAVYDSEGSFVKIFPGTQCLFLEDGGFVSASNDSLKRFDKNFAELWAIEGHFHHQLNWSFDKSRILALGSKVVKRDGKDHRLDTFLVVDMAGKILAQQDAEFLMKQMRVKPRIRGSSFMIKKLSVNMELTHFNSFHEIPPQTEGSSFEAGNFVVNALSQGIFILSQDLSKVRSRIIIKDSSDHSIHDVQIRKNGNLLFFNNEVASVPGVSYSAAQEVQMSDQKLVTEFSSQPREAFFSKYCGSVQELADGDWLIAHMYTGAFLFSPVSKSLTRAWPSVNIYNGSFYPTQQIRTFDLRKFFSHGK